MGGEVVNGGHGNRKLSNILCIESFTLVIDLFEVLLQILGQSLSIFILAVDELAVEFIAAHLVDGDLIHFSQVLTEFLIDPVIELY